MCARDDHEKGDKERGTEGRERHNGEIMRATIIHNDRQDIELNTGPNELFYEPTNFRKLCATKSKGRNAPILSATQAPLQNEINVMINVPSSRC